MEAVLNLDLKQVFLNMTHKADFFDIVFLGLK